MYFSAEALPIGVKFCVAVRQHLRQVFSHFGGDSPRDGRVLGVNRGHMADMLLAEALILDVSLLILSPTETANSLKHRAFSCVWLKD